MTNPYVYRGPLHESSSFYGRRHELNEIGAFLKGNQSISLVGPRKIGKTSLLFHLLRKETRKRLELDQEYLFVYLDCEVLGDGGHEELFGQFAAEIEATLDLYQLPIDPVISSAVSQPGRIPFERAVRWLNQQGRRVIMMLDEFERLSVNPNLNVNFFNALRSAASRYRLAFLTASAKPLIQLTYSNQSQDILSSPFFNIFAPQFLGLFSREEATQAIQEPAQSAGSPFTPEQAEQIYLLAGGHPLAIQVAGFYAYEHRGQDRLVEERTMQELNPHFQYYWHNLTRSEQKTMMLLNNVHEQETSDTTIRALLRDLVLKCLLIGSGDDYVYPYRAWQLFVDHQASLSKGSPLRLRDSLVGVHLGPYEITEPLARGGMAEIYKGRHTRLERVVAIKVLPASLAVEEDFRQRFEREAQAVAGLRHPNIVQVYDFGDVDGLYYMVMEFIDGESLAHVLKRKGKVPLEEAMPIIADLAAALDYAHERGLVHRDVKPSNILLQTIPGEVPKRRAILSDFGIAKIRGGSSNQTRSGVLIGTLDYIAPEQIKSSGTVTKKADIYSVGIILYQMLTGELPFTGDNPGAVMLSHMQDVPPDPRLAHPDLPDEFTGVIDHALAKDPDERPESVRALISVLQR